MLLLKLAGLFLCCTFLRSVEDGVRGPPPPAKNGTGAAAATAPPLPLSQPMSDPFAFEREPLFPNISTLADDSTPPPAYSNSNSSNHHNPHHQPPIMMQEHPPPQNHPPASAAAGAALPQGSGLLQSAPPPSALVVTSRVTAAVPAGGACTCSCTCACTCSAASPQVAGGAGGSGGGLAPGSGFYLQVTKDVQQGPHGEGDAAAAATRPPSASDAQQPSPPATLPLQQQQPTTGYGPPHHGPPAAPMPGGHAGCYSTGAGYPDYYDGRGGGAAPYGKPGDPMHDPSAQPYPQVFKFIFACRLSESGLCAQAYCEVISRALLMQRPYHSAEFITQLIECSFVTRIREDDPGPPPLQTAPYALGGPLPPAASSGPNSISHLPHPQHHHYVPSEPPMLPAASGVTAPVPGGGCSCICICTCSYDQALSWSPAPPLPLPQLTSPAALAAASPQVAGGAGVSGGGNTYGSGFYLQVTKDVQQGTQGDDRMSVRLRFYNPQLKEKPEQELFLDWLMHLRQLDRQNKGGEITFREQDRGTPQLYPCSTPSSEENPTPPNPSAHTPDASNPLMATLILGATLLGVQLIPPDLPTILQDGAPHMAPTPDGTGDFCPMFLGPDLTTQLPSQMTGLTQYRFANSQPINDPLQTVYQLMPGRMPAAATCCGDEKWGDWRPHLAMIFSEHYHLTYTVDLDMRTIATMGDTLASKGLEDSANFCYVMVQVGLGVFTKNTKMVLIVSTHSVSFETFGCSEAIQAIHQSFGSQPLSLPNFQCCGDEKWGDWRPHLAMIFSEHDHLTYTVDLDMRTIATMGDTLDSKGLVDAAHFGHIMGQVGLGVFTEKTTEMVLIGSNHILSFEKFCSSEAIQCTEAYEYAQSLGSQPLSLPNFQVSYHSAEFIAQLIEGPRRRSRTTSESSNHSTGRERSSSALNQGSPPPIPEATPAQEAPKKSRKESPTMMFNSSLLLQCPEGSQSGEVGLGVKNNSSKMVVIGSNHSLSFEKSEALQRTEAYEYAQSFGSQPLSLPNFQVSYHSAEFIAQLIEGPRRRSRTTSESSNHSTGRERSSSALNQGSLPPPPIPEATPTQEAPKKSRKESPTMSGGGGGGWFTACSIVMVCLATTYAYCIWLMKYHKKNQAFLPDDRVKSIVWDERKKKWVNQDEPEVESKPPPPPPSSFPKMAPAAGPGPGAGNVFRRRGAKTRYLDAMNPGRGAGGGGGGGGAPAPVVKAPADLLAPLAPMTIPTNLFTPNAIPLTVLLNSAPPMTTSPDATGDSDLMLPAPAVSTLSPTYKVDSSVPMPMPPLPMQHTGPPPTQANSEMPGHMTPQLPGQMPGQMPGPPMPGQQMPGQQMTGQMPPQVPPVPMQVPPPPMTGEMAGQIVCEKVTQDEPEEQSKPPPPPPSSFPKMAPAAGPGPGGPPAPLTVLLDSAPPMAPTQDVPAQAMSTLFLPPQANSEMPGHMTPELPGQMPGPPMPGLPMPGQQMPPQVPLGPMQVPPPMTGQMVGKMHKSIIWDEVKQDELEEESKPPPPPLSSFPKMAPAAGPGPGGPPGAKRKYLDVLNPGRGAGGGGGGASAPMMTVPADLLAPLATMPMAHGIFTPNATGDECQPAEGNTAEGVHQTQPQALVPRRVGGRFSEKREYSTLCCWSW